MNQVVRKASAQDLEQINYLVRHSARSIQTLFYKESVIESALELVGDIETLIQESNFYVVDFENRIIACGGINPCKVAPLKAEVKSFFVHPEFARRGIATELLKICETQCLRNGIESMYLTATLAGEPFYKKYGFTELQRFRQPLSSGETFELVKMQKVL